MTVIGYIYNMLHRKAQLNRWKWYAHWSSITASFYARCHSPQINGKQHRILMHREILGLKYGDKRQADHINHNTLDNRRCNLRICSHQQNGMNQRKHRTWCGKETSSRYNGVSWRKDVKKWGARICFNGKHIHLGYFTSEAEAAKAYDTKALELFGEYANLNLKRA